MKKRILPILMVISIYLFAFAQTFSIELNNSKVVNTILSIAIFCLVIIVSILNMIYPFILLRYGENSKTLLFWNMFLKLFNIPIFALVWFAVSLSALMTPFIILLAIIFDYMLLLASSMYGVNGLIKAYREGKIAISALVVNIILHFIFCLDVISAITMYIIVKRKDKNM